MEKRYKYMDEYLSRDLLYKNIHPLGDAAFGAECLTPVRILKIVTVGLKMDSGNAIKNCYVVKIVRSESAALLDKVSESTVQFRGYLEKNRLNRKCSNLDDSCKF